MSISLTSSRDEANCDRELDLRRERVLHFATRAFLQRGYDSTSLDDIAMSAHVSKKTIYTLFGSKDNLLEVVILDATADTVRMIDTDFDPDTPVEETLISFAENYIDAMLRPVLGHGHFYKIIMLMLNSIEQFPDIRDKFLKIWNGVYTELNSYFANFINSGKFLPVNSRTCVQTLFDIIFPIDAYMLGSRNNVGNINLHKMARNRVRAFLYGLTTPPGAQTD